MAEMCEVCRTREAEGYFHDSPMCKGCAEVLSFLEVRHWLGEDVKNGVLDGEDFDV